MSHIINGKTETDQVSKTVTLYPAEDHTQLADPIEGFFQRSSAPQIFTDKVEPRSRIVKYNSKEQNRFIELKFQDSTDAYINDVATFPDEYRREIDLGEGKAQTTTYENPIFEPTNDARLDPALSGSSTADGLTLPHLWDNTDSQISNKINPRIAFHYGLVEQVDTTTDPAPVNWTWESALRTSIGFLSQTSDLVELVGTPTKVPIAFANYQEDLYRLHYKRWIRDIFVALDIEFLVRLNYNDYRQINFRRPFGVFYSETFLLYTVTAVRDFDLAERTSTPVNVKLIEC